MWCVPQIDEEYIHRMEDVLELYNRPINKLEPVVCLDEKPIVLHDSTRAAYPMKPGRVARKDYEYKRCGTANTFCILSPKEGRHLTFASRNRKRPAFADAILKIAHAYPRAHTIHLVLDNLNTHNEKSLIERFGPTRGAKLWARFSVHYTPKHASWLNQAEIGISLYSRECLGKRRIPTFEQLEAETKRWSESANDARRRIEWKFTVRKARTSFGYVRSVRPGSRY